MVPWLVLGMPEGERQPEGDGIPRKASGHLWCLGNQALVNMLVVTRGCLVILTLQLPWGSWPGHVKLPCEGGRCQ